MPKENQIYFDYSLYQQNTFYEELGLDVNEKQQEKFIKGVERYIRTSLEYRNYIKYLKQEVLLTQCSILNKLPEELSRSLTIEMHHWPFTLYDLVEIVLNKHLKLNNVFTRLSIANEVMDLHYTNSVGLIPLTKTMHQLAHTNNNVVHRKNVFGNYQNFIDFYEIYLDQGQRQKIENFEKLSETLTINIIKNFLEVDEELYKELDDKDFDKVEVKEISNDSKKTKEESLIEILSKSKESAIKKGYLDDKANTTSNG